MELVKIMRSCGIVGAGGAGFPSYAKLAEGADTLLINGAECEPLLYTDYVILKNEIDEVISGASAVIEAGYARRAILAIKSHTAKRLSLLDGDALAANLTVKVLPDVYPMGDEVSLIYQATGRLVKPGRLPITVGVIVFNVETVYNISRAVRFGEPVTEKWLTVGGDIERSVVLKAPVGMRVSELLKRLGITVDERHALLDGGPSMGKIINPDTAVITKTTKGLLLLPEASEAVRSKRINLKMALGRAETACCQCTRCTDMCPRYLLGYPLEPHKMVRTAMGVVSVTPEMVRSATLCCGCGICESLACSQGISPKAVINNYKALLAKNKMRYTIDKNVEAAPEREYRQIPSTRWASTLGVAKFDKIPEFIGELTSAHVEIPINTHIGAPAAASVTGGDGVEKNAVIATAADGLSVAYHAPISGRVTQGNNKIIIDKVM